MPHKDLEQRRAYRRSHPELKCSKTKKCLTCGRPVMARGLCSTHYMRWRRKNVAKEVAYAKRLSKRYQANAAKKLPDWFLRKRFAQKSRISASDVPDEVLPIYRLYIL